jgi:UDP-2,3-diacylglucosamine pyrophosphatase LpxH
LYHRKTYHRNFGQEKGERENMAARTKTIFISDIHMGCNAKNSGTFPYVWFNKNAGLLAQFLNEKSAAPDVNEVVILGDLFDRWVVPADMDPIIKLADISSDPVNQPVIEALAALAASNDIKLSYVPGNHDMALDDGDITVTRDFMQAAFPGINLVFDDSWPLGTYRAGPLVAEHGDRYCLFNAPDRLSNSGSSFLPLGYFISRMVAYKACKTGKNQDVPDIFAGIVDEYAKGDPNFAENTFHAIARDCGLDHGDIIVGGLPGYPAIRMTVDDIGARFGRIDSNWGDVPGSGRVSVFTAVESDGLGLDGAADDTYFRRGSDIKVVIFGHTHIPALLPDIPGFPGAGNTIYANTGAWVDGAKDGCTYVETEAADGNLHVRLKGYRDDAPNPPKEFIKDEGYVET